jgi:1-hydroxycarotenoid 3,4-desaturase
VVVGAGIGGLATAIELASAGVSVIVLERAAGPGGKLRTTEIAGRFIDVGPTVLTMKDTFDELFAHAGARFDERVSLRRAETLARHVFADGSVLDLHTDPERSVEAIRAFAGPREADGYRRFMAYAGRIHDTVEEPFLRSARPTVASMVKTAGRIGMGALLSIDGHRTLWASLGGFFGDARLRMLFGRYATYTGSSPFHAPATLNVIAEVERRGVWLVDGGMGRVARAFEDLALSLGIEIRYGCQVDSLMVDEGRVRGVRLVDDSRVLADAVVWNGDAEALQRGLAGPAPRKAVEGKNERSLSAFTVAQVAETAGVPLLHHTVFFSGNYEAEFTDLEAGRAPNDPTVYVCAQDRTDVGVRTDASPASSAERLFFLTNAPARGDDPSYEDGARGERRVHEETYEWRTRMARTLARGGLEVKASLGESTTTPRDFARAFPGTGGALYGPASHGMMSPFARSGATTRLPGLYLAGGSAHPGAGVPMVTRSGMLAAKQMLADHGSTWRSAPMATLGGTSMR